MKKLLIVLALLGLPLHGWAADVRGTPNAVLFQVSTIDAVSNFNVRLPRDEAFAKTDLSKDREHELNKVER